MTRKKPSGNSGINSKSIHPKVKSNSGTTNKLTNKSQVMKSQEHVTVTFPSEEITITVAKGFTVLDAAIAAGVFINSVCGGIGRCGKCKIKAKGKCKSEKTKLITPEERNQGLSLACMTKILGDTEIHVPEASKVSINQILTKCDLVKVETPKPFIWKYHLKLSQPTLEDNVSDFNRIKRSLIKEINNPEFNTENISVPISILRQLPTMLRESDWDVTVTVAKFENYSEIIHCDPGDTTDKKFGLCVDIGTTTIVVELIDLNTGERLGCVSNYNKQKVCGEDVLSRIIYAEEHGVEILHQLVIENINYLINKIIKEIQEQQVRIEKKDIFYIVLAGNTTMTHMLLNMEPTYIRRDPYIPTLNLIPKLKAKDLKLDINPECIVYCLPCRSSWVGGDITADILASDLHNRDKLSLLIDVGTNGEVVLGNSDWMVGCSCSAGPAFEGGEVQFGMNASLGAIEKVQLTDELDVKYKTIGNAPPRGICGSGLIDIMSELFTHKVIDKNGKFKKIKSARMKVIDGYPVFVVAFAKDTGIDQIRDIYITETDIKNILRTKAAIYAACYLLLQTLGYTFDDLENIFIAGGFGNYLDTKKSIMLGLLPDVPLEKFKFIGNGSLAGAYLTLISEENKAEAEAIFEKLTYIELSVSNKFYNEFVSALFLPHTNLSLFPSVKEIL